MGVTSGVTRKVAWERPCSHLAAAQYNYHAKTGGSEPINRWLSVSPFYFKFNNPEPEEPPVGTTGPAAKELRPGRG